MDKIQREFYTAIAYGRNNSTCKKLAVGASFVRKGRDSIIDNQIKKPYRVFGSNSSPDFNCKRENECYKAKVTGIYESCEETRKYCKAIHAECNLIENLKKLNPNANPKTLLSNGAVYVTRYPCKNCALELVRHGVKELYYCGIQPISEEVETIFNTMGVKYEHHPEFDFETEDYLQWLDIYNDNAYDFVGDNKQPIVIPSYNKPWFSTLKALGFEYFTDDYNWPVYMGVRVSQIPKYKETLYKVYGEEHCNKFLKWVEMPDELENDPGASRNYLQKYFTFNNFHLLFEFDDDMKDIGYSRDVVVKGRHIASNLFNRSRTIHVIAMWQIAMERMECEKILISSPMVSSFSWKGEYVHKDWSSVVSCGSCTQCVCLNLKGLRENNIFYDLNRNCGFDDIDLKIRVLDSKNNICEFPWISYSADRMGNGDYIGKVSEGNFLSEKIIKRFEQAVIKCKENFKRPWISYRKKRGLDQVCIKVVALRKWQFKEGIIHGKDHSDVRIDIWEDGKLIGMELGGRG